LNQNYNKRMNRIIIVPDVHGRSFWRDLLTNKEDHIIFLGDYSDPYSFEGLVHKDALRELSDIIQFKKENSTRVILLWGNHDLSYLDPRFRCCRYSSIHAVQFKNIYQDNFDLFQVAADCEINSKRYLFTHAGVNNGWISHNRKNMVQNDPLAMLKRSFDEKPILWSQVSEWRGGDYEWGSPVWADLNEHDSDGAFPNLIQIFGHSMQDEHPEINGRMWCVDCKKIFVLEKGELREYAKKTLILEN